MITISVDTNACENYGQCCFEAQDLFALNDAGTLVYASTASDDRLADIEAAADACPMQAINLMES